ncbi:hypothetical protein SLA2020_336380 [Shorea laevis]
MAPSPQQKTHRDFCFATASRWFNPPTTLGAASPSDATVGLAKKKNLQPLLGVQDSAVRTPLCGTHSRCAWWCSGGSAVM